MPNHSLEDALKNLESIQESIKAYNRKDFSKESFDSQEASKFLDDIQRMLATTAGNLKSVLNDNDNDLTKDDITDYVIKAADTQLAITELINELYKKKKTLKIKRLFFYDFFLIMRSICKHNVPCNNR